VRATILGLKVSHPVVCELQDRTRSILARSRAYCPADHGLTDCATMESCRWSARHVNCSRHYACGYRLLCMGLFFIFLIRRANRLALLLWYPFGWRGERR